MVTATYLQKVDYSPFPYQYPRVMGYYDTDSPDEAFHLFVKEYASDLRRIQLFYDDVLVIPVPATGFKYKLSKVFGELAQFPNPTALEELSHEQNG